MGNDNVIPNSSRNGSLFCSEFVEIVQLILDGEAKEDHKRKFNEHYMHCKHCVSFFEVERIYHQFLRQSINGTYKSPAPDEFHTKIRALIQPM